MNYNKVPVKLSDFCQRLNANRAQASDMSIDRLYGLSFDAHYDLVTIHPWADGNGRMARLVMNMLQFEFGLIPTKICSEDKEDYIKALVETREKEDINIFRAFMLAMMEKNLTKEIEAFLRSIEADADVTTESTSKKGSQNSSEKIIAILSEDGKLSAVALAKRIGISAKAVEKHLARLKTDGLIERVGPAKGGHWVVKKQR